MKPYLGPQSLLDTGPSEIPLVDGIQFPLRIWLWARLWDTDREQQERLWEAARGNDHLAGFQAPERAELSRGWAELAYWFGALSGAAGAQPVQAIPVNISLEEEGEASGLTLQGRFFATHSYLVDKELVDVWKGFKRIRKELEDEAP
jgi:hypothetical protein